MVEGFRYNGVHSNEFNLYYIPQAQSRALDDPEYSVIEQDLNWVDGGIYYKSLVKIREFELDCYFEDIDQTTKNRMLAWIGRDTVGELTFDSRPYVHYTVRPSKKLGYKIYLTDNKGQRLYSGTFTLRLKAFDPFGYMDYNYYTGMDKDGASAYCGIMESAEMPPAPAAGDSSFLVYNCGTEATPMSIKLAGTLASPITFINNANQSRCTIKSLPSSPAYLMLDATTGRVESIGSTGTNLDFACHDDGFISLESCGLVIDNLLVNYTDGSNMIYFTNADCRKEHVGRYIRIDGEWHRIIALAGGKLVIDTNMTKNGAEVTKIVTMNQIIIDGDTSNLTAFEIDYQPRVL